LTTVFLKSRHFPPFSAGHRVNIKLNNQLSLGDIANGLTTINTSPFLVGGIRTFIQDNGRGVLQYYRIVNDRRVIVRDEIGTVNYLTGEILIERLFIDGIPDGGNYIDFTAIPRIPDVFSKENQIILLEEEDVVVNIEKA
jgi:hypothetical protein